MPSKGVAGLQSDFHIEQLFEIRDTFEKAKQPQKTKCEDNNTTGFCREMEGIQKSRDNIP